MMTRASCSAPTRMRWEQPINRAKTTQPRVPQGQPKSYILCLLTRTGAVRQRAARCGIAGFVLSALVLSYASGEEVVLYGAGSLREVMTQIATDYQKLRGLQVRTDFGPSGLMRQRIERGERVDVFASADLGHPLTLQREGRATVVAMFTRNTLCAVDLPRVGLTTANFLDSILVLGDT